ncbi:MAG: FG-GAP repeat domain-containing protein [Acidimicrobiia bacterium]
MAGVPIGHEDGRRGAGAAIFAAIVLIPASWLLATGGGDGTRWPGFAPPVAISLHDDAADVAVEDVDGNGRADLVTANPEAGNVSVLLSEGDRRFGAEDRYGSAGPAEVVIVDLDGDGDAEGVTTGSGDSVLTVLPARKDPSGAFAPSRSSRLPGLATAVSAGDPGP